MRTLTWLDGRLPYERACEVLAEIGRVEVSTSSNWRMGQRWGREFQAALATEEVTMKAQAREWSTPGGRPDPEQRMGLAMDGAMVHLREEGWKEFKVGTVFDVEVREHRDPQSCDLETYGHAVHNSYVAHLGGPEVFGWKVWTEAQRRGWTRVCDTEVLGDAASWIWTLYAEHFHTSLGVVDWYHATEHLGKAAQALYPEGGAASARWYNAQKTRLHQGHAEGIARDLAASAERESDSERAESLRSNAGYFKNNRDRMQYQDYRIENWPIGSGMVESEAKQFKARVVGSGMRWSRPGADNILAICSAVLTGRERFDQLWDAAYANLPPS
jgi:hypothetical protein